MGNQIEDFFSRQGSIGLILAIGIDGARFNEITEQVVVSHDTLSTRIDEARNMGLINTEGITEVGTSFTNRLTDSGEICYIQMIELGVDEAYTEYTNAIEKYNRLSLEFTHHVKDESRWLQCILDNGSPELSPWRIFNKERLPTSFPSDTPKPIEEAVQQKSLDPLEDLEYRDFWLWMLTSYPPEPNDENRPPEYRTDDREL